MDNSKLIEEYSFINSSYINNLTDKSKRTEMFSKSMSINEFFNSEEYKGLEKKYPYCNLLLYTNSKLKKVIYNMKTKKFYDEDLNEIVLTDKSKSNYMIMRNIDIIFNEEYEPKKLTLREYKNIIENHKELYVFKHEIHIECDENGLSDYVNIIFGERETIVLNDSNDKLVEGKNGEFNQLIIEVNLSL